MQQSVYSQYIVNIVNIVNTVNSQYIVNIWSTGSRTTCAAALLHAQVVGAHVRPLEAGLEERAVLVHAPRPHDAALHPEPGGQPCGSAPKATHLLAAGRPCRGRRCMPLRHPLEHCSRCSQSTDRNSRAGALSSSRRHDVGVSRAEVSSQSTGAGEPHPASCLPLSRPPCCGTLPPWTAAASPPPG